VPQPSQSRRAQWLYYSVKPGANGTGPFGPLEAEDKAEAERKARARLVDLGLAWVEQLETVSDAEWARVQEIVGRHRA
jgi:hypothetical protein